MPAKRFLLAMTVAAGSLTGLAKAGAVPASIVASQPRVEAPIVRVDYDYPGYYRYRYDHRYGGLENTPLALLTIPGKILGTAFGALASGFTGDPYANPNFADPYYAPYYDRDAYYDDRYEYLRDRSGRFVKTGGYHDYEGPYDLPRYRPDYSDRYGFDYDYGQSYGRSSYRPRGYSDASYDDASYYDRPAYQDPYGGGWSYRDYGGSYARSGEAACEREFRSFDPETGTYINRYGERAFCPYLHP